MKAQTNFNISQLLTVEQVATALCVSKNTVFRWRIAGKLPLAIKLTGGSLRFKQADIERFIESSRETDIAASDEPAAAK